MDKKTVTLVGAISALPFAVAAPAGAKTVDDIMTPQSYAELLEPIPNAAALLKEMESKPAPAKPMVQTAQYYGGYGGYGYYHHHHHHHHHWGW